MLAERELPNSGNVVVKLDVEGAEISAFRGAQRTADAGAYFIYEDGPGGTSCHVTRFLIEELKLNVYTEPGSEWVAVKSVEEVRVLMSRHGQHNLLATSQVLE